MQPRLQLEAPTSSEEGGPSLEEGGPSSEEGRPSSEEGVPSSEERALCNALDDTPRHADGVGPTADGHLGVAVLLKKRKIRISRSQE